MPVVHIVYRPEVVVFNRGATKRSRGMLMAMASIAMVVCSTGCSQHAEAQAGGSPQAPAVSVVPAVQRSVRDSEEFSGRLEAIDYVDLRPRVTGTVDKVHFVDGVIVRKGDLLFTIDPRSFQAEVARSQAQLAAARARHELAQQSLGRAASLFESQAASKEEVDTLNAGLRTSLSDIQGAESALRVAQLNLDYTQVRAPIAGRTSRANIREGNLVNPESVLTSIAGVSRIYAYFDGSEQTFLRLQSMTKAAGKAPRVQMGLANEVDFPHEGQLDFVDNRLNPQTGAIRLRASFDNSKAEFTPGLAAHLRMESPVAYDAVLVPERAIGTDQSKKFVYVVGGDGKPQVREVRPGTLFEGMRVIESGVRPGEHVVVDGMQRIQPGITVAPEVVKVDAQGLPIAPTPAGSASAAKT